MTSAIETAIPSSAPADPASFFGVGSSAARTAGGFASTYRSALAANSADSATQSNTVSVEPKLPDKPGTGVVAGSGKGKDSLKGNALAAPSTASTSIVTPLPAVPPAAQPVELSAALADFPSSDLVGVTNSDSTILSANSIPQFGLQVVASSLAGPSAGLPAPNSQIDLLPATSQWSGSASQESPAGQSNSIALPGDVSIGTSPLSGAAKSPLDLPETASEMSSNQPSVNTDFSSVQSLQDSSSPTIPADDSSAEEVPSTTGSDNLNLIATDSQQVLSSQDFSIARTAIETAQQSSPLIGDVSTKAAERASGLPNSINSSPQKTDTSTNSVASTQITNVNAGLDDGQAQNLPAQAFVSLIADSVQPPSSPAPSKSLRGAANSDALGANKALALAPTPDTIAPRALANLSSTLRDAVSTASATVHQPGIAAPVPSTTSPNWIQSTNENVASNRDAHSISSLQNSATPKFSAQGAPSTKNAPAETADGNTANGNAAGSNTPDQSSSNNQPTNAVQLVASVIASNPATTQTTPVVTAVNTAVAATATRPADNSSSPKATPGNLPATSPPAQPATEPVPAMGPVQMAQMLNRAAQSEMRVGLNTSAFGNVEVHTVVHAGDVGLAIGSERGDLRSLLANEIPSIANNLQQQNLRLNQVNFHQGSTFLGNSSSGGDAQPRNFTSAPTMRASIVESNGESTDPVAQEPSSIRRSGLNILA